MNFQYIGIGKDGYIEVFQNNLLYLRVKQANYFRTYYTFYKGNNIILKSRIGAFAFWRWVKILAQDLEQPITYIETVKLRNAELHFSDHILYMESHFLKKKQWILFKDGVEVGWVQIGKKIFSLGGEYDFYIEDENEIVNLYFLILFVASLAPSP